MIRGALAWATGPALPWVAGGLLLALGAGALGINNRAYDRGHAACEAAHTKAREKAAAQAAADAARRQGAVDGADTAAAATIASEGRIERTYVERVREIYRDRPDPVCIDAGGMRLIQEADRAAGDPGAAGIGLDAVRTADAGGDPSRK